MYAMQQLLSRAYQSSTNVGSLSIVLTLLLLCGCLHIGSSTVKYKQRKHRAAGQASPAGLSVCKSLAPSRCRLSKHTNCSKGALAVLSVCTEGLWKHGHIRLGQHAALLQVCFNNTFQPQNLLSLEKVLFEFLVFITVQKKPRQEQHDVCTERRNGAVQAIQNTAPN